MKLRSLEIPRASIQPARRSVQKAVLLLGVIAAITGCAQVLVVDSKGARQSIAHVFGLVWISQSPGEAEQPMTEVVRTRTMGMSVSTFGSTTEFVLGYSDLLRASLPNNALVDAHSFKLESPQGSVPFAGVDR